MKPRRRILSIVGSIFNELPKRHVVNVALFAWGLWEARRVCLAHVARCCSVTTTPRHTIKRLNRFLGNDRVDDHLAQQRLLQAVVGPRALVFIALDWTKIRDDFVLAAGVVHKGRTVPVMWTAARAGEVERSFNNYEDALLVRVAEALPAGTRAVILADRGFKRVNLLKHLHRLRGLGLSYIIRTGGNVHIRHERYQGRADRLITGRRQRVDLDRAQLRSTNSEPTRIVGVWYAKQKEPWILSTDLDWPTLRLARAYGTRFRIEETFRDAKCTRFGLSMKLIKMRKVNHLVRLLLIVAVLYWIVLMVGIVARKRRWHRRFQANTLRRKRNHSDFTLGLHYIPSVKDPRTKLLRHFYADAPSFKTGDC